ncbi:MAG: DivIVA domain-containing protein [Firmicutes bacterium]|nr:DivIVA domain-containing protein [Erysipelotrichaceae bacterium]MDD6524938.1 DivIVA domain-containing protein [Bacillota bacterium]MDD7228306.1 DivIVA domain-containing protein [Bacillota bacterium]MDY5998069.1 DivIVA domain-containing protein [Erysipelotrichaceae bacterium]
MAKNRPSFRVMRNGYDRFAVDSAIDNYTSQIEELEKEIATYKNNIEDLNHQLINMKDRYNSIMSGIMARERAADDISRIALKEANQIIDAAKKNADFIIMESLNKSKVVLADLVKISNETGTLKQEMRDQLNKIYHDLDELKAPNLPDLDWLEQAKNKRQ